MNISGRLAPPDRTPTNPSPTTSATVRRLKPRTALEYMEAKQISEDRFYGRPYDAKKRRQQIAQFKQQAKNIEQNRRKSCRHAKVDYKIYSAAHEQLNAANIAKLEKEDAVRDGAKRFEMIKEKLNIAATAFVGEDLHFGTLSSTADRKKYAKLRAAAHNEYCQFSLARRKLDKKRREFSNAHARVEHWRRECHFMINP